MNLRVCSELAELLLDYWLIEAEIEARFLAFLLYKRAGVNSAKFVIVEEAVYGEFVKEFLKELEDGPYVNPSHHKEKQLKSGPNIEKKRLVRILKDHSSKSYNRLYPCEALEFQELNGQTGVKFKVNYIAATLRLSTKQHARLSLSKVAVWLYRTKEFKPRSSLGTIKKRFREEFHIEDDEFESLFVDDDLGRQTLFCKVEVSPPVIPENDAETVEPPSNRVQISRIVRRLGLVKAVKSMYNYRCQICGKVLRFPDGQPYAEVHHIKPLGEPHRGRDRLSNVLCVCPNHHVLLDHVGMKLDASKLKLVPGHEIDSRNIKYHNDLYTEKFEA